MAYNPFDFFRKNQKIFFAVLTIIVMFMFVLSFGQGDFFSWFPRWLEQQKSSGDVLVEVGGSKVRESDLGQLARKRVLANQFMAQAADVNLRAINQRMFETQGSTKVSEDARRVMREAQTQQQFAFLRAQNARGEEDIEHYRQTLLRTRDQLVAAANKAGVRDDDKDALLVQARLVEAELGNLARQLAGRRGEGSVYFANMPNRSTKDQLEFLLWLKKADQLGVRFSKEGVEQLVQAEFAAVSADKLTQLASDTAAEKRIPLGSLYDALADEFRVRAAQAAVLGATQVRFHGGFPAAVPYDLFEFYKGQTDRTRYAFVAVPAEPFVPLVTGEPTDAELRQIFKDYRSADPDPANPKSGIREPRKVKVEWAEVTGTEAYYEKPAEDRLKAAPGAQGLLGMAAAAHKFPTANYDDYKDTQAAVAKGWAQGFTNIGRPRITEATAALVGSVIQGDPLNATRTTWRENDPAFYNGSIRLADESVAQVHNVGVLAGLFGGSFATGGSPFTAPVVITETGFAVEKERRLVLGVQAFHFPTLPGLAGLGELTGADMAVLAGLPKPLPQPVVQPILDRQSKAALRFMMAEEDIREFDKKLAELMKGDGGTKAAADYVAKFIADRGLKSGRSTELRDMHTIANDPGVAHLIPKSGMADPLLGTLTTPVRKSSFGATLFMELKPSGDPRGRPQLAVSTTVYDPFPYPPTETGAVAVADGQPQLLAWRTEDVKAEIPKEFNDPAVRAKCLQKWKELKARELAKKAAEEVVAEVKKAGDSAAVVNKHLQDALTAVKAKLPTAVDKAKVTLIDKPDYEVARLVKDKSLSAMAEPMLRPFVLQPNDDFVYASLKMTEELLANREKPVGSGVVLADVPETTYYAAVITAKEESGYLLFRENIFRPLRRMDPSPFLPADAKEMVESRHAAEARKEAREEAVALLKAEFGYANENPDLEKRAKDTGE
jgi:hypothetical protein